MDKSLLQVQLLRTQIAVTRLVHAMLIGLLITAVYVSVYVNANPVIVPVKMIGQLAFMYTVDTLVIVLLLYMFYWHPEDKKTKN